MKSMVLCLLAIGCGGAAAGGATPHRAPAPAEANEAARLSGEADAAFARRGERAELVRAIELWTRAVALDPGRADDCARLGRATQLIGETHDRKAAVDDRVAWFERGIAETERCLRASSSRYRELRGSGVEIEDAIEALDPVAAPLVYRYANNLGSLANAQGRVAGMKYKDRILALMTWVMARAPRYDFGGPDRFFGAYYAAVPAFLGGDLGKSRSHFDAAIAIAPGYPDNHLLLAEYYAVAAGDRALFDRVIAGFANLGPCTDATPAPCTREDWAPEAVFTARRAAELAARADSLF